MGPLARSSLVAVAVVAVAGSPGAFGKVPLVRTLACLEGSIVAGASVGNLVVARSLELDSCPDTFAAVALWKASEGRASLHRSWEGDNTAGRASLASVDWVGQRAELKGPHCMANKARLLRKVKKLGVRVGFAEFRFGIDTHWDICQPLQIVSRGKSTWETLKERTKNWVYIRF